MMLLLPSRNSGGVDAFVVGKISPPKMYSAADFAAELTNVIVDLRARNGKLWKIKNQIQKLENLKVFTIFLHYDAVFL